MKNERKCRICKKPVQGRSDKVFCSIDCKNYYHVRLRAVTATATGRVDSILHRNRSILLELMGKNGTQKQIKKADLDQKKFNYAYITGYHVNSRGKTVHRIYDFSYVEFSDQGVLIYRKK